ncbi:helix-turn-helix domain-containing protein [Oceanobacillus salinisoli]|uniref:helix-turn-helix domain-containing protein n=1 Tax=Oceanobacillus salinisoli TaxID=2678611 RepID=UPI0012E292B0|nr:helix-turn-helix domain-containing protein [Oceanobacillus salinisoli]
MQYIKPDMISAAMKLYNITNLNTYVLEKNGDFIYHEGTVKIPAFMPGSNETDILYAFNQITEVNKLYSYHNEWDLRYLAYSFQENDEYTIIIGPFLDMTPDIYGLTRRYHLNNNESEDLRIFLNQLQVVSTEKANSYASVLNQFRILFEKEPDPEIINPIKMKDKISRKKEKNDEYSTDEDAEIIKARYEIENKLIHAIENGNRKQAKELPTARNMLFAFSDRFPNQPLRRVKNLAIVLNTLLRTAAKNSDVPVILIHRISEKYAFEIEYTNQLLRLHQLYDEMIDDYLDLIISNSLKNYSKVTQKVIEHLFSFYDKQIDKEELAAMTFTHPSHLSRKFKQETGLTITGYQQMLRINRAKFLLKTETLPIEEISWLVGYEDSSYFTRVFKKETGYTPTQYREKN